jgi:hypothetical protein
MANSLPYSIPSLHPSFHPSIHPSTHSPIYPSTPLPLYPSTHPPPSTIQLPNSASPASKIQLNQINQQNKPAYVSVAIEPRRYQVSAKTR